MDLNWNENCSWILKNGNVSHARYLKCNKLMKMTLTCSLENCMFWTGSSAAFLYIFWHNILIFNAVCMCVWFSWQFFTLSVIFSLFFATFSLFLIVYFFFFFLSWFFLVDFLGSRFIIKRRAVCINYANDKTSSADQLICNKTQKKQLTKKVSRRSDECYRITHLVHFVSFSTSQHYQHKLFIKHDYFHFSISLITLWCYVVLVWLF